jgi:hypothetical protein
MAMTETTVEYVGARTQRVTADNAIEYAYRELGDGDVPLVLLQHFRGNLASSSTTASSPQKCTPSSTRPTKPLLLDRRLNAVLR